MKNSSHPFPPPIYWQSRSPRGFITAILILFMTVFSESSLLACEGTPVPPCGRSIFLGKYTPEVVVFPDSGDITVPIGVYPFVSWNPIVPFFFPACPQPAAATLTLTLTCFPSGLVIGPQAFPVATPMFPGGQPVGPLDFIIPAGVFGTDPPPQICLVVGTYTVTFTDGAMLSFTGDTEVCLVDPSPIDRAEPRLDMQYISTDSMGAEDYKICRRGDQANFYFLIANNDPTHSVDLDLNSIGRQVSQLPDGITPSAAYDSDVYAISNYDPETDAFAAEFTDALMPGQILPEPDPTVPNAQTLTSKIVLQPLEATIIGITMRSFGMCADGSCNERLVRVEGLFANGDLALACASTLYVVGDAPPKTPLCEYDDAVKVEPFGDAIWSRGEFMGMMGPIPHAQTFSVGNISPDSSFQGFWTTGDSVPDMFPSSGNEYIRLDQVPGGMNYSVDFNSSMCGQSANFVNIQGLNVPNPQFNNFPVIFHPNAGEGLNIQFDVGNGMLNIVNSLGGPLYNGSAMTFFQNPPQPFCVDPGICRTITKRFSGAGFDKSITVVPDAQAHLFTSLNPPCDTFTVFDQSNMPATWDAIITGNGLMLPATSGTGLMEVCFANLTALPRVPQTTISYIEVTCPGAVNNPVRVPIAIRLDQAFSVDPLSGPLNFDLLPAYPNPFTSSTTINYSLEKRAQVSLVIYNHVGQKIRTLVPQRQGIPGSYSVEWDGASLDGSPASAGFYFCKMTVDGVEKVQKLVHVN